MIEDVKPDLSFNTETWLHANIKNAEVRLSGFNDPIRKDRTGRRGGGCLMYAKQGLMLREENIAIRRNEIVTALLPLVAPPLLAAPQAATSMSQAAASVAQAAAPAP